ncbi:MAG: MCP four helix bundle domain-containing protein [Bacteroidia bacterium]|nr:MCP four helix bundle domain-containing protein [Bacteroidia bacterium]MCF8425399.1 MCP four helix bundle domain-containing protein [Bacteroidia bacterium]MCF8448046.1 MCP four helix bundle domain-containing protein [Bacteroidia bacterium]
MKTKKSTKITVFFLILFVAFFIGLIAYNTTNFLSKSEANTDMVESSLRNSNALTQAAVNTALGMQKCYQLIISNEESDLKEAITALDSIKSENEVLMQSLEKEAKSEEQKDQFKSLENARKRLIADRNIFIELVQNEKNTEAKKFFLNQLTVSVNEFFHFQKDYSILVRENAIKLDSEISKKNQITQLVNQYLFWLALIVIGLFIISLFLIMILLLKSSVEDK